MGTFGTFGECGSLLYRAKRWGPTVVAIPERRETEAFARSAPLITVVSIRWVFPGPTNSHGSCFG